MEFKSTLEQTLEARFSGEDGLGEMVDIHNHGIMGGFHGFMYTTELNNFFSEFEGEIEDHYWNIYGEGWLREITTMKDFCSLDELRAHLVWGVAEDYVHRIMEFKFVIDSELDSALVG